MKKILLLLLPVFFLFAAFYTRQTITITGNITGESGGPVPFATVTETGTRNATTADGNGEYHIAVGEKAQYLDFTATGFEHVNAKINHQTIINVVMKRNKSELSTVVVMTALAIKRKGPMPAYKSYAPSGYNADYAPLPPVIKQPGGNIHDEEFNTEEYGNIIENSFQKVSDYPLSTFSIDVDAASYSNVRRYINDDHLPPAGAVRTEEMINYFKYQYPQPAGKEPFSINTEISDCPWNKENKLVLIGLQGKNIPVENLPASNLVFLIDVSGSMMDENKLPLVQASMKMLTDQLREKDRISMVVYAGNAGMVLPSVSGAEKIKIKTAIDDLEAAGSTAGGEGIRLAYKIASKNFIKQGNNRIILCTDGDFNVGASSDDDMVRLIEGERNQGIYLTVLGYGMGNYKDSKMQQLADKGNGNHAYIDGLNEARKVLVNEFGGTLFTIAKDVKLQLEFNPGKVAGYRLIGYENRMLNKEDFNDDKKDAGDLGSGHTVTALYEIIPAGVSSEFLMNTDSLKYQKIEKRKTASFAEEILTVKFRYKDPGKSSSQLIVHTVLDNKINIESTSDNFRFASSIAGFAMLLRNSEYKGSTTYQKVLEMASGAMEIDIEGYRKEFIALVKKAEELKR